MSRISIPSRETVPANSQPSLNAVEKQIGVVPNLFRVLAKSPATLQGFLAFSGSLNASLDAPSRERIAIAVAEQNRCNYCLSAHTYLALNVVKLTSEEIDRNRAGRSDDAKADAAVRFAVRVLNERGHIADADLQDLLKAGYTDSQAIEIVALVAINVFTNYLNSVAATDIDFPVVHTKAA